MSRIELKTALALSLVAVAGAHAQVPSYSDLGGDRLTRDHPKGTRLDDILWKVDGPIDFQAFPSLEKWASEQRTYPDILGWLGDSSTNGYEDYKDTMDRLRQVAHRNEEAGLAWLHARAGKMARYYEQTLLPHVRKIRAKVGLDHGRLDTGHTRDRRNRARRIPDGMRAQYEAAFASFDEAYQNQVVGFVAELSPEVSRNYMSFYRDLAVHNIRRSQRLLAAANEEYDRLTADWKGWAGDWRWVPGTLDHLHPFTTRITNANTDIARARKLLRESWQIIHATRDFDESFAFLVQARDGILAASAGDPTREAYLENLVRRGAEDRHAEFQDSYEFMVILANTHRP